MFAKRITINTDERQISQNVHMSMNSMVHGLNNNIIVIGGSGSGKSFRVARPLLRQMTGSYIVTDPKGELAKKEGRYLEERGYEVQVVNMKNSKEMENSARFNPFFYIENDVDIERLSANIMANTAHKNAAPKDPFFDGAAQALLTALITYVCEVYRNDKKNMNFRTVMHLLSKAEFQIDPKTYEKKESELDRCFSKLEEKENLRILREQREGKVPKSMSNAVIKYNSIMRGAADTVKSVVITLDERLSKLHIDELLDILSDDDINIPELGMGVDYDRKTKKAIFLVIPDNDTTFNFVIGMFYTTVIQKLYETADILCGGELPISVSFLMDEFANVSLPEDFDKALSTMRSRNINSVIIIQNMAQIKALYEKQWETITGNCDVLIYLGGNEQSTHKYISEMLDKGTFDKRTHGETSGQYGNASKNYDVVGRELFTPGEVRKLDNKKCIVLIRGFDPILDYKIKTDKHPLFKYIKEDYKYDRRKQKKKTMRFASSSYVEAVRRKEEYDEKKKIFDISGEVLMKLSSEAITSYSETGWYSEMSDELLEKEIEISKERLKNIPLTDKELMELDNDTMQKFLVLREAGYSDRQIKVLLELIKSGKGMEEAKKLFPASMNAERMEVLVEKITSGNEQIKNENGGI